MVVDKDRLILSWLSAKTPVDCRCSFKKKDLGMANDASPFQITSVPGGFQLGFEVRAVKGEGQVKKAQFGHFEILCDEGINLGGADSAPPPLAYFAASIAF